METDSDVPEETGAPAPPSDCGVPENGTWSVVASEVGDGVFLSGWRPDDDAAVWIVGGDLAGGPGVLARYDGSALCTEAAVTERALWWVHGISSADWYAVGEAGTVLHVRDGVRTREDLPTTANLYGVWHAGEIVWAVGGDPFTPDSGEVWKREDGSWSAVATGLPGVAFKVWEDVIVGDRLGLRITEGGLVPFDQTERLLTVRGRSPSDIWAVGGLGGPVVRHFDGADWSPVDTMGLSGPLNGVWTAPETTSLWVAGFTGLVAHYDGTTWETPPTPLSVETLHAATGGCGEVLFLGGNFLASGDFHGNVLRWGTPTAPATVGTCD